MADSANSASFLGTGWSFPPRFSAGGAEVELVSGVDDIHQCLQILLNTQVGERIMQEDFGCDLSTLIFEEIDHRLVSKITTLVSDAILYHEPRIKLLAVDVSRDDSEAGLLYIQLDYSVIATNSRYNMVYPFYIEEAVGPG